MVDLGYATLSEEHGPQSMVDHAIEAEERGLSYTMVSDHYHPWTTAQGESPFVWNVLGAMAEVTETMSLGTAVTAPIIRIHPAIIAQAAATSAVQAPDRFIFGVGTGENLNEHFTGARWPAHDARLEMLSEAIDVMHQLWTGESVTHRGEHYTVENARIFTHPEDPPPVPVAAGGPRTATAAGRHGDGLIATAPDAELVDRFKEANDGDAMIMGQAHVCYDEDRDAAIERAYERWPNAAIAGELGQELATPRHFEQAAEMVDPEDVAERVVCGADSDAYIDKLRGFVDAGFTHVHLHNIGEEQSPFIEFYTEEVVPSFD